MLGAPVAGGRRHRRALRRRALGRPLPRRRVPAGVPGAPPRAAGRLGAGHVARGDAADRATHLARACSRSRRSKPSSSRSAAPSRARTPGARNRSEFHVELRPSRRRRRPSHGRGRARPARSDARDPVGGVDLPRRPHLARRSAARRRRSWSTSSATISTCSRRRPPRSRARSRDAGAVDVSPAMPRPPRTSRFGYAPRRSQRYGSSPPRSSTRSRPRSPGSRSDRCSGAARRRRRRARGAHRSDPARRRPPRRGAPTGATLPLGELADVEVGTLATSILHEGGRRRQTVTCNVEGRDVTSFVAEARTPDRSGGRASGGRLPHARRHRRGAGGCERDLLLRRRRRRARNRRAALRGGAQRAEPRCCCSTSRSRCGRRARRARRLPARGRPAVLSLGVARRLRDGARDHDAQRDHDGLSLPPARGAGGPSLETPRRRCAAPTRRVVPIVMTALVTGLGLLPVALAVDRPGGEIDGPMAIVILGGCSPVDRAEPPAAARPLPPVRPLRAALRGRLESVQPSSG